MGTIRFRGVPTPPPESDNEPMGRMIGFVGGGTDGTHEEHYPMPESRDWPPLEFSTYRTYNGGYGGMHMPPFNPQDIHMRKVMLSQELAELERMEAQHPHMGYAASGLMRPGRKLEEKLEGMMESAISVSMNPPDTWKPYLEGKDMVGLVEMESKELVGVLKKHAPAADVHREMVHTLAAMLRASL